MKLARFKNIPAIINLTWHALPADQSERSAIKATMEQNKGVKAGVVVKYGGVTLLGLGPPNVKVINGPSAIAWLSIANQKAMDQGTNAGMPSTGSGATNDWIVVENLGDGTFWLGIVRDGVPLPGTDITLDRETTLDLIREAVETAPFIVYSPDEGIRGDVPAGTMVENKGFADLVQGVKPGKAAMRAVSGVSVKLLAAVAGLLVLGLLWFAYSWWSEKQKVAAMAAQAAAQSAAQQKQMAADKAAYSVAVRKAVLDALDKGAQDLDQALATPSPNDAISTWVGMIADVSPNQNGWSITGFECSFAADGSPSCKVSMRRDQYGINRILLQDHPDVTLEGDTASYMITGGAPTKRSMNFRNLERSNTFNLEFVSDLQMLQFANVSYSIGASQDVVSAVALPPVPASIFKPGDTKQAAPAPGPVKMGVASGDLTFTGSELWQLEGMREFLHRENIVIKGVNVGMSGISPSQWTLTGTFYIKNAPEPVLPVIVGPDKAMIQVNLPDKFKATPEELASWTASSAVSPAQSAPASSPNGAAPAAPTSAPDTQASPLSEPPAGADVVPPPVSPQAADNPSPLASPPG